MANNKKNAKKIWAWLAGIACVVLAVVVVAFIFNNGNTTEELSINGTTSVSGLKCTDKAQTNIIFSADDASISHTNTTTAVFLDGSLSSITYAYEGSYTDEVASDHARDLAETGYYSTLADYGLEATAFTKNASINGDMVYFSITATDGKNLSSKTAPIFMLNKDRSFPTSIKDMESAYRSAGFSCEVENNQ